jgi:hypothetical protein
MVNNSININKTNNHLSPQIIKHKKDHDTWLWKCKSSDMIFSRFWDRHNPIFCCQFRSFRSAENRIFFVSVPIVSELRNSQILLQRVIWLVQYFISSNDKFFLQYWPQSCLVLFRHVGMSSRVVVDGDFNTKTLDKALKNVWKWEWLEKKVWEELIAIKT